MPGPSGRIAAVLTAGNHHGTLTGNGAKPVMIFVILQPVPDRTLAIDPASGMVKPDGPGAFCGNILFSDWKVSQMTHRIVHIATAGCLALTLQACGSVGNLWPLGGEKMLDRSRTPADASEYRCKDGKRFHVRYLEGGAAAWLILPEREVRLGKLADGTGQRYGNGIATLSVDNNVATLTEGNATLFNSCAAAGN